MSAPLVLLQRGTPHAMASRPSLTPRPLLTPHGAGASRFLGSTGKTGKRWALLLLLWAGIYFGSLFTPPLLDDADSTHAQAAQAMLHTGDLVTLHVNGIRYLEKPPLPYWLAALSLRLFGENTFAIHFPLALTVLGLASLGWHWARRAFDSLHLPDIPDFPDLPDSARRDAQAGFYTALFLLTSAGVFLFTRVFIPDALLSLLSAASLYAALHALETSAGSRRWAALLWLALAAAVLTKGLVALLFVLGTLAFYLPLAGELPRWRRLHPLPGIALFLVVAAPWHILAGLRNRGGPEGHGFFWFYFINEHVLRFLGRRYPPDYNKLPTLLYWSLHLVWLFPWSFLAPAALSAAWRTRRHWLPTRNASPTTFGQRTTLLLAIFSALVLIFFSFSTNQEYYTFPVYLPLLMLLAVALSRAETDLTPATQRLLVTCQAVLTAVCLLAALTLAFGLWSSRRLSDAPDVGDLVAHRGVGDYTLSMSHFFDLTAASFSALRLPATLACAALALGASISLFLRIRRNHRAATFTLALMGTLLLVAAHLALNRFRSLLSSRNFALQIQQLESTHAVEPDTRVLLYGDQALGSSIPFYLGHPVYLVDGRSTSMIFGSTFPDAPPLFLSAAQLRTSWGHGSRKLLFVPLEHRADADHLLGTRAILLYQTAGKALFTDRPLLLSTSPAMDRLPGLANNGAKP